MGGGCGWGGWVRKRGRKGVKCLWAKVDLQCLNSARSLIEVIPLGLWFPVYRSHQRCCFCLNACRNSCLSPGFFICSWALATAAVSDEVFFVKGFTDEQTEGRGESREYQEKNLNGTCLHLHVCLPQTAVWQIQNSRKALSYSFPSSLSISFSRNPPTPSPSIPTTTSVIIG